MIDYNKDVIYNGHIYKVKDILFEALIYGYSNNTKKNSYISWIFYRRYSYAKLLLKIIGYNKDINSLYKEKNKILKTIYNIEYKKYIKSIIKNDIMYKNGIVNENIIDCLLITSDIYKKIVCTYKYEEPKLHNYRYGNERLSYNIIIPDNHYEYKYFYDNNIKFTESRDIYREIIKNLGYYIPDSEDSYEFLQLIATNEEISQYTELLLNDLL